MEGQKRVEWKANVLPDGTGQLIPVEQLVSPTPRLVSQMTGRITTKLYHYANLVVDQFCGFRYMYLKKTPYAEYTIKAKKAFEIANFPKWSKDTSLTCRSWTI